jgi:hypothetical protein
LNARTGLSTPPGRICSARVNRRFDREVRIGIDIYDLQFGDVVIYL